jgi:16S rRNA pseudouridine516 synthase
MRLDRYLSNHHIGSRQQVKKVIKDKQVKVNDVVIIDPAFSIDVDLDLICVNDRKMNTQKTVLYMLNKPKGYVCANHDALHPTVISLFSEDEQKDLNIVGRLDIDTEGLLLLTNDGQLIHELTSPRKDVYKKYIVETEVYFQDLECLIQPMKIYDGKSQLYEPKLPKVARLSGNLISIEIKEGKFHQIKRMIIHCGHKVHALKRVAIGDIQLDEDLPIGSYKMIQTKL